VCFLLSGFSWPGAAEDERAPTEELVCFLLSGFCWTGEAHLRQQQYSPASMRRKVVVLKVFCGDWMRKRELTESPFLRVKLSFGRIEQLPRPH